MVLLRNLHLQKHAPEQLSWLAAETAMLCTTKKFVKSVSAQITSKCCEDGVSQPIKINGKSSAYFISLFLCWCDTSSWRNVQCRTFCHGRQKVPRTEALHMLGALCWSDNAHKLFCIIFFVEFCCWWDSSPRSSLSASRFGMVIWNNWKRKSSHQEVMHKSGNWTERYDWSSG